MKRELIVLVTSILLLTSCNKSDLSDIDCFAFGTAYGECQGNCATFFKIEADKLYPDDMDYYSVPLLFKTESLAEAKYKLAKNLVDNFPQYLLDNPDRTFGCPDCADQGGIHIELREKGELKYWHIDTVEANQPEEIRNYIIQLINTIETLKQN